MNIFRFEMKQYRGSILIWSIGLVATIILLLPMFASLTRDPSAVEMLGDSPLLDTMGINPDLFFTTVGIFAYLNSFILVAAAIQACNLGLSIITKEHMQNTADFLITKPYSRANVFFSKLLASLYVIGIIGLCYFLASLGAISVVVSRVSATLPLALGIAFGLYVIGLFSNVIQSTIARLFSPFRYFDINLILSIVSCWISFLFDDNKQWKWSLYCT